MPTAGREPEDRSHPWGEAVTPFEEIGGADAVRALAHAFYDVIEEESPRLREMLPANTSRTREKFSMYLSGWLGGPPLYEERWGHPRLRMRHMPFDIGRFEADEWMRCMRLALNRSGVESPLKVFLDERFEQLADHMRNKTE